jgi:hypothetical protein
LQAKRLRAQVQLITFLTIRLEAGIAAGSTFALRRQAMPASKRIGLLMI